MPLVMLCGHPSSGKTTRANELIKYLNSISTTANPITVQLINFETLNLDRNTFYKDLPNEKAGRASIKAAVSRLLNPTRIVICDYNNSIKGYRYELYCMAREQNTTHAVIFCDTDLVTCAQWNDARSDQKTGAAYTKPIFDDVSKRLETPNDTKKWDHPLFTVAPNAPLPSAEIYSALNDPAKAPKPTAATIAPKAQESNYLFEVDRATQYVVKTISAAQSEPSALPTDDIRIIPLAGGTVTVTTSDSATATAAGTPPAPAAADSDAKATANAKAPNDSKTAADGTAVPAKPKGAAAAGAVSGGGGGTGTGVPSVLICNFGKKIAVAELNRLRRSYLKLAAMRPPQSTPAITKSFVDFLNSSGKETLKD